MDTFENPVADGDRKVDAVPQSFEDESSLPTAAGSADAFESEPAQPAQKVKMFQSKDQYADHSVTKSDMHFCLRLCSHSTEEVHGDQLTDSVVEFDPIPLAEDQLIMPSLVDINGYEISLEPDVDIDPADIPAKADESLPVDIAHLAVLEKELQMVHELIRDAFDPRNPDGNSLKNQRLHKLHAQAADVEKRIDQENKRLQDEENASRELARKAGENAKKQRSASGKAALSKFRMAGKNALMAVHSVNAVADAVNHVTIDDAETSLGIDWHFQNSRAVCAAVREGGSAARYMGGKVLRAGMVLKSFSTGRKETEVTFQMVQDELKKYPKEFGMTPGHCLCVILDHTRPMTLHFCEPGFDLSEADKAAGIKASAESLSLGFAIQDLKYLVPKSTQKLGMKFWKTRHGVALCDIEADSVAASDEFLLEGVRPGLLLSSIISADGFTRDMVNTDLDYTQIMRQLAISQRPCVYVFRPVVEPLEFSFDEMAMSKPSKRDKRLIKDRSKSQATGQKLGFSIFRHLGLSLREEEHGQEGSHDWRVRVTAILPGGLIDRFNRTHSHAWVTPGMTISTLYSPMYHITNAKGLNLAEIVGIFHKCAPGTPYKHTSTTTNGSKRTVTLDGRSITIGFEVTLRALQRREINAVLHGGHRGETETADVDMSAYD